MKNLILYVNTQQKNCGHLNKCINQLTKVNLKFRKISEKNTSFVKLTCYLLTGLHLVNI